MKLIENKIYVKDIDKVSNIKYEWERFKNKNLLITGATGMIGSFMVDVLMHKNALDNLNCKIIALGRNREKAKNRFESYFNSPNFLFFEKNINEPIALPENKIDFIVHSASNTHPIAYATDPIGTISTNVIATKNLLDLATQKKCERFIFLSSVEIYGENKGDANEFAESYCGYIDCNTLRAGYPESKRVGESLCQAYIAQNHLDIVIPRLSRVFGPTMLLKDSKALSQFLLKAVNEEDIVLKSEGNQFYSYMYVGDAVSAIIKLILDGKNGEAYNVSNPDFDVTLKDLASSIAKVAGKEVVFEIPDETEKKGYSKATKAILNINKLKKINWTPIFKFDEGIQNTISIIRDMMR